MFPTEQFWNEKFQTQKYFYGEEPNQFLKEHSNSFKSNAKILSLGEGEGRNALYLAKQGFNVTASDASSVGLEKIKGLAQELNLTVETRYEDVVTGNWNEQKWDGVINIYCHLPKAQRIMVYEKIKNSLNSGGIFLTEMFSEEQLNYKSGGPPSIELLLTLNEFKTQFESYSIIYATTEKVILDEGRHRGEASVVRFIVQKP